MLIVGVSILATLAIAFIVPQAKLSLVAGIPQAFAFFFKALGVGVWATKLMAGLVGDRHARADQHLAARAVQGPLRV